MNKLASLNWDELLYFPVRVVQLPIVLAVIGIAFVVNRFSKAPERWLPIENAPDNRKLVVTENVVGHPSELLAREAVRKNGKWLTPEGAPLDFEPECYLRESCAVEPSGDT